MAQGFTPGDKVAERIRSKAKLSGIHTDTLLRRYVLERALYRLTEAYGSKLMLKGSMVALIDDPDNARPAPDADVHLRAREDVEAIFPEILTGPHYDSDSPTGLLEDHVVFGRLRFEPLQHSGEPGVKVKFEAWLGQTRVHTHIDVGFGHKVTAPLEIKKVPAVFDGLPPTVVYCQPVADRVADKVRAMFDWGMDNTRVKDVRDIAACIRAGQFDIEDVAHAIAAACEASGTEIEAVPASVTDEYATRHEVTWQAWLAKSGTKDSRPLSEVIAEIRPHVIAAVREAVRLQVAEGQFQEFVAACA